MIESFFPSLKHRGVEHLLISGQATVLYGAATFSEDIDLWLDPAPENCARFAAALRDCGARYYKLTPPLAAEHLERGHGFHFVLAGGAEPEFFVDVMGKPPRAGAFSAAIASARWMETEWGPLRTIGLKDLVELKKTQRVEDYPIISNLALAWFDQPEAAATPAELLWSMENIFTLSALTTFFEAHPGAVELTAGEQAAALKSFGRHVISGQAVPEQIEEELNTWMQRRMAALQQADRRYWRDIIAELKKLRSTGQLMPDGSEV